MNLSYLNHPGVAALLNTQKPVDQKARLDSANSNLVADSAAQHVDRHMAMCSASSVQQWAETDEADLGEGEGYADRLWSMMVGVANDSVDGALTEEEATVADSAANHAWNYLAAKGVSESDLDSVFNSEDPAEANAAAARVREYLASTLPEGEEAESDEADDFAFGGEDQEGIFDAVYKKKVVVKNGKKVRVNKRISGVVRLSAPQKVAIRKAHMKSNSAKAMVKRMKSLRVRKAANL